MGVPALLIVGLLASADGGTALAPSAGVERVESAAQADGGQLPPGYWLSDERMSKVGEALQPKPEAPTPVGAAFFIGLGLGLLIGGATVLYIGGALR